MISHVANHRRMVSQPNQKLLPVKMADFEGFDYVIATSTQLRRSNVKKEALRLFIEISQNGNSVKVVKYDADNEKVIIVALYPGLNG